jgi:hypothetical protein
MISKLKIISKNCTEYNFRFESKNFVIAKIVKLLFTFIGAVKMQKNEILNCGIFKAKITFCRC